MFGWLDKGREPKVRAKRFAAFAGILAGSCTLWTGSSRGFGWGRIGDFVARFSSSSSQPKTSKPSQ